MQKLASLPIWTVSFCMELSACFSLKVTWKVSLLLQLVSSVGIGTGITKFTFSIHFPISTHLSLLFEGVLLLELDSFLCCLEVLLLTLSCCLAKIWSLLWFNWLLRFQGAVKNQLCWGRWRLWWSHTMGIHSWSLWLKLLSIFKTHEALTFLNHIWTVPSRVLVKLSSEFHLYFLVSIFLSTITPFLLRCLPELIEIKFVTIILWRQECFSVTTKFLFLKRAKLACY